MKMKKIQSAVMCGTGDSKQDIVMGFTNII